MLPTDLLYYVVVFNDYNNLLQTRPVSIVSQRILHEGDMWGFTYFCIKACIIIYLYFS